LPPGTGTIESFTFPSKLGGDALGSLAAGVIAVEHQPYIIKGE
jgi:hypothetical protein